MNPDVVTALAPGEEPSPTALDARLAAICGGYTQSVVLGADTEPADTTPCVHCDHPHHTHGRRYAAIPGWHNWTAERQPYPGPPPLWLPPAVGNNR